MNARKVYTTQANGLEFAYYSRGEGPLVLCLHGFPDTADTWHETLEALANAGYRAVAPFMRGYPPTEIPGPSKYTTRHLGEDVLALIDALGEREAILIGHDWGASAVYCAANLKPEKVSKLITLAIPHPRAIKPTPTTLWRARHFLTFQLKERAIKQLKSDGYIREIYERWAPSWDVPESELEPVKKSLSTPGAVEAALGYYWDFAASRNDKELIKLVSRKTSVPTLAFGGAEDGAVNPKAWSQAKLAYTGPYKFVLIPDAGHFPHREAFDVFIQETLAFLKNDDA